jgi:hypothetical protein
MLTVLRNSGLRFDARMPSRRVEVRWAKIAMLLAKALPHAQIGQLHRCPPDGSVLQWAVNSSPLQQAGARAQDGTLVKRR